MELRNEEQFEKYLKQFRPIAPQHSLPKPVKSGHDGMIWLTAVAAIWILIALAVGIRDHRSAGQQSIATREDEHRPASAPLTISRANLKVARSKSMKAALDDIAFRQPVLKVPSGSQSALEVLGKERTGL